MSGTRDIIEPTEHEDLVHWASSELWDGMSDGGRAAWLCGYMILKLRRRCPRAKLAAVVRTAVACIDAGERLRDLQRGRTVPDVQH